jgi:hypothetical protein
LKGASKLNVLLLFIIITLPPSGHFAPHGRLSAPVSTILGLPLPKR